MSDHLVSLLGSLRKNYTDLIDRVDEYHKNESQENLRRLASLSKISVTMTLQNLINIAERDIDAARDYINNAWLAVKFEDTLRVLGYGVYVQEEHIPFMDSWQISEYKNNLLRHIDNIDYYIQTIKDESEDRG